MRHGGGGIQSKRDTYFTPVWIKWKNWQRRLRAHFSVYLAFLLVILVAIRERAELYGILMGQLGLGVFEVLILIVTLLTLLAFIWEMTGNKLATSPQEVRFVIAMRTLLSRLEKFAKDKEKGADVEQKLVRFIEEFLELTCTTLCGKKEVDGCFMYHLENTDKLQLLKSSHNAQYPASLEIPLPANDESPTGPAGIAYTKGEIVYVPIKKIKRWRIGLRFKSMAGENYKLSGSDERWIDAPTRKEENFWSVLCFPVAIYEEEGKKKTFGVLNYSTRRFDPFVTRDYIMGECFSSILAQAWAIAQGDDSEEERPAAAELED